MKTNTTKSQVRESNLPKSDVVGMTGEVVAPAPAPRPDRLPRLDFAQRHANRQLPTSQLLELLHTTAPEFFTLAEVVGQWVWIRFSNKQPRDITFKLSQLGFHWNNKRQVWQNPCGHFTQTPYDGDPRERYGSIFPAQSAAA